MRTSSIIAAASAFFAATALAVPTAEAGAPWHQGGPPQGKAFGRGGYGASRKPEEKCPVKPEEKCMSKEDADIVAGVFQQLIQGYTIEMAEAALTEDFVDYSSAVSIIINKGAIGPKDVTEPIFVTREEFMSGHGKQKGIPFETLNVWHNCNGTVSMRWVTSRSAMGQPTEVAAIPVIGNAILETEPAEEGNEYNYRIHTLYSEFNTAAWLVNLGVFDPEGETGPVPADKKRSVEAGNAVQHWSDLGGLI